MEGGDADGMEDDPMEEDKAASATSSGKQKVTQELRDKVQEVLKQKEYGSQRSAKLTQDDFLLLLSLFNQAGFHFA